MADTLYPPSRPLSIGEVLDLAFRIFRVSLLKCLPLAVVALLLQQMPNIYALARGGSPAGMLGAHHDGTWWTLYLVGVLLAVALWGAILILQHAIARGRPITAGEALGVGFRRLPGMIGVGICVGLAVGVWFVPLGALIALSTNPVWRLLAILVVLLPVCWLGVRLLCANTAYLLTARGVFESVGYSWSLTDGSFWRLVGIYTVAGFVLFVFYILVGIVAAAIAVPLGVGEIALITAISASLVVILGAFATPFFMATSLAVFGDLTVRKEGTDLAAKLSSPATP